MIDSLKGLCDRGVFALKSFDPCPRPNSATVANWHCKNDSSVRNQPNNEQEQQQQQPQQQQQQQPQPRALLLRSLFELSEEYVDLIVELNYNGN